MPHNLRRTGFGLRHKSKHDSTAVSNSPRVAKKRLCVARRRASFQTRSMGASCGLYGGRNSKLRTLRYRRSQGASNTAWWYFALSSTITIRLPRERCRSSFFRKAPNVRASNFSHRQRTSLPVRRLTEPKQATDLRVGACRSTGSLTSGGTHIRQRVPCCWKWHSSRLHSSTSRRLASRRSFFKRRDLDRVGLGDLGSGLAQSKSHLAEEALALPYPEPHPIAHSQVLRKQLAVPQMGAVAELRWIAAQIASQLRPLFGLQHGRSPRPLPLAQTLQATGLKAPNPALHRAPVFSAMNLACVLDPTRYSSLRPGPLQRGPDVMEARVPEKRLLPRWYR